MTGNDLRNLILEILRQSHRALCIGLPNTFSLHVTRCKLMSELQWKPW